MTNGLFPISFLLITVTGFLLILLAGIVSEGNIMMKIITIPFLAFALYLQVKSWMIFIFAFKQLK